MKILEKRKPVVTFSMHNRYVALISDIKEFTKNFIVLTNNSPDVRMRKTTVSIDCRRRLSNIY